MIDDRSDFSTFYINSMNPDSAFNETNEFTLKERLSKNIAYNRKKLGLTQVQLAERLGVETETLSRFERGKSIPSLLTLEKISQLLSTSVADLLSEQPKTADNDALIYTAWISELNAEDKYFVHTNLKQMCDFLRQKTKNKQII